MLAPLAEAASAELLITELGAASLEAWPALLAELPELVFFQRNGTLVVWHPTDRAESALFTSRLARQCAGRPAQGRTAVRCRARRCWPRNRRTAAASSKVSCCRTKASSTTGNCWPVSRRGLAERRVDTHWNTRVEDAALDALPARIVIDCRGLGAKGDWRGLRGIRGEVARVHAPGIGLSRPVRLLHPRYPLYIAPKQDDLYVIGATEIEGEDMSPISVRSSLELLSAAFSIHRASARRVFSSCPRNAGRPLPDHRPLIRLAGERMIRVNGLYRHGYMLAPEVSRAAVELALALAGGALAATDAFEAWSAASRWPALFARDIVAAQAV